jgi:hypothetical protein
MLVDPDGKWAWLAINAAFAIYDGYKAYKAGDSWKKVAWAAGSNLIGLGKLKKAKNLVRFLPKKKSKKLLVKSNLQLFAAKKDLKMVNDAAKQIGVDRKAFGNFIHQVKKESGMKANENFTFHELLNLAKEYKGK